MNEQYNISDIENRIILGDNLEILKKIPDNSVDLIYLDPPFFSQRRYEVIWGDEWERRAFDDIWKGKKDQSRKGGIEVYKEFMRTRLEECHRVLKPTGTIFLHCDKHANHHLRLLLDDIFGANHFINEIIWHYGLGGSSKKKFQQKHDNIYWYAKGDKWIYNIQWVPATSNKLKGQMKNMSDVWNIPNINNMAKERLGYPTQKPEALLERIILAASNEGDLVLDPFCGCGTTLAVAKRLNRRYIGIDVSWTACKLMADRLNTPYTDIINWVPDRETALTMDPYEFQAWVCTFLKATCNRRGADNGIDGWFVNAALQVKQRKISRGDVTQFSADMRQFDKTKDMNIGVIIAPEFSSKAEDAAAKLKNEGITIILLSLDDLLNNRIDILERAGIFRRPAQGVLPATF